MANRRSGIEKSLKRIDERFTLWMVTMLAVAMPMFVLNVIKQEVKKARLEIPCYECGRREAVRKAGPYDYKISVGIDTGKAPGAEYVWLCSECQSQRFISAEPDGIVIDGAYSSRYPLVISFMLIIAVVGVSCVFGVAAVALWRRKLRGLPTSFR